MDRKAITALVCFFVLLPLYAPLVYPNDGGLDSYGCHEDGKLGDYHCHWGMFAGQHFISKTEMLRQPPLGKQPGKLAAQYRVVRQVVSGNTLVLENNERVHLMGVNTLETIHSNKPGEHFGREAFTFTKWMVEGKRVRLEYDDANARFGHKDRYRRTLVYLFLEDGTFLNAEIIKQGYGFANTQSPFKYLDDFSGYQQAAKAQGRGLWEGFATSQPTRKNTPIATGNLKNLTRPPAFVIGVYRTRHSTIVYSQPKEYSKKVYKLKKGTTVNVVGIRGDWLMIKSKHGKIPGFIRKHALIP